MSYVKQNKNKHTNNKYIYIYIYWRRLRRCTAAPFCFAACDILEDLQKNCLDRKFISKPFLAALHKLTSLTSKTGIVSVSRHVSHVGPHVLKIWHLKCTDGHGSIYKCPCFFFNRSYFIVMQLYVFLWFPGGVFLHRCFERRVRSPWRFEAGLFSFCFFLHFRIEKVKQNESKFS